MTDSSIIQDARDVLAKWRASMTLDTWRIEEPNTDGDWLVAADDGDMAVATVHGWSAYARLIVGTAGNPELLDAIDGFLAVAQAAKGTKPFAAGFVVYAERIAAAILTANERMGSE